MSTKFAYAAIDSHGVTVRGVARSNTPGSLAEMLQGKGLSLVEAKETRSFLDVELTTKKVPRRDLVHFSRQLAVFLRAGIPILDAIEVITEETGNKVFRRCLVDVSERLRGGETFAACVAAHPEAFPEIYLGICRSAELTGNIDTVLDQLAGYIERDIEARRKIVSALVYPAIVFALSIVAAIVITVYVIPKFETFFASLHARLPLPTRMLLSIAHFLSHKWFIWGGVLLLFAISLLLLRVTARGRRVADTLVLKLPVVGDIVRFAILERFCRILSSMAGAGVPLPEALAVTTDTTGNAVFRGGLVHAQEAMVRGEGLAGPLAETGLFPAAARQMLRVGEETGTLDDQMATAASYFDRELELRIARFTSLFEPAVTIFMGVIVGFVAIAMISAMYGIFNQVKIQ